MYVWSLADELGFIRNLGLHRRREARLTRDERIGLLGGYQLGLALRERAGGLDLEAVRVYAAYAATETATEERLAAIDREFGAIA